jgi:hypothetical protein
MTNENIQNMSVGAFAVNYLDDTSEVTWWAPSFNWSTKRKTLVNYLNDIRVIILQDGWERKRVIFSLKSGLIILLISTEFCKRQKKFHTKSIEKRITKRSTFL